MTGVLWKFADRIFPVAPALREEFSWLVLIVGISLSFGLNMSVFSGAVEGFQRFDVWNRIRIVIFALRGIGWFILLASGYGLVAMGCWSLVATVILLLLYLVYLRRIFPALNLSPKWAKLAMFRQTMSYGIHTFVANLGSQSLDQTPSLLIGYFRGPGAVSYFNFPLRTLQYVAQAITNVGLVVMPQSTFLAAKGELDKIARLGVYANRYCLSLFMPLAIFLTIYGKELFSVWVTPEFAEASAPLLLPLTFGYALAQAAQFCSSSILFGLAKQKEYGRVLVGEAIAGVALLVLVVPRYGAYGAAIATVVLMTASRGGITPWLVCRQLDIPFAGYMRSILTRPIAVALPVWAVVAILKDGGLAGRTWSELILAGLVAAALYLGVAYHACLEWHHRQMISEWTVRHLLRASSRVWKR